MILNEYKINEIFYSIQGEGVRAGTVNIFVRFAGCNLKCDEKDIFSGFICDTEFTSGTKMTSWEILQTCIDLDLYKSKSVIFTGGEPALQLDKTLVDLFKAHNFYLAIETNGTQILPSGLDWITVSPKSAEHTLKVKNCSELKYVRHRGQGIPKPIINAEHYLISPAFESDGMVSRQNLEHCIRLCHENPAWRLSLQLHKLFKVR